MRFKLINWDKRQVNTFKTIFPDANPKVFMSLTFQFFFLQVGGGAS